MTQVPLEMDESNTARCDMLLSPGTRISASILGALKTSNSDINYYGDNLSRFCFASSSKACNFFASFSANKVRASSNRF